jgi:hypothetical protein
MATKHRLAQSKLPRRDSWGALSAPASLPNDAMDLEDIFGSEVRGSKSWNDASSVTDSLFHESSDDEADETEGDTESDVSLEEVPLS